MGTYARSPPKYLMDFNGIWFENSPGYLKIPQTEIPVLDPNPLCNLPQTTQELYPLTREPPNEVNSGRTRVPANSIARINFTCSSPATLIWKLSREIPPSTSS